MSAPSSGPSELAVRSAGDPNRIYLQLMGDVQLYLGGEAVTLPGPKPLAVLAYLHLTGGTTRDELAEVFWPDKAGALQNVRQALTTLRRLGGDGGWVREERSVITLAAVSDVGELMQCDASSPEAALPLALGHGTILERLAPPSPIFEAWLDEERRRLRGVQLQVLRVRGEQLIEAGAYDGARDLLRRALYMEALADNEATYRALMLLEYRAGRAGQALEVFEECRRMLDSEFGLEPEPQTLELLRRIEERQSGGNRRGQLLAAGALVAPEAEPVLGRDALLEDARARLSQGGRVLLHGLGGIGKTHLAREVARRAVGKGRCAWLEVGADPAEVVLGSLRELLHVPAGTPLEGALAHSDVRVVVLDDAASTYAAHHVLAQLPASLPVVVTSRLRLPGLPTVGVPRLPRDAAAALLSFHLKRTQPPAVNVEAVCALLGDHPFALRLAARTLAAANPADVLRALHAAPHDTVRALLDRSVAELGARAYEAYLAIGSLPAPQATPELLAALLERPVDTVGAALVQLTERGLASRDSRPGSDTVNFHMHDLTWHAARVHGAHLTPHVCDAVVAYAEAHAQSPDLLAADLPHLLGVAPGAAPRQLTRLMRAWLGGHYIAARGFPVAHLQLLQSAITAAEADGDDDTASVLNGKYADISQALLGDHGTAIDRLLRASAQAERAGVPERRATQLALAGQLEAMQGRPTAAGHLEEARTLADRLGDPVVQARVRGQQAVAQALSRDFTGAHRLLGEARALLESVLAGGSAGAAVWTAYLGVLGNLGQAEMRLGNLEEALKLKEEMWRVASGRDDHLYMARAALDQGELLHQLGRTEHAAAQLRESVRLSQSVGAGSLESVARRLLQDITSAEVSSC